MSLFFLKKVECSFKSDHEDDQVERFATKNTNSYLMNSKYDLHLHYF